MSGGAETKAEELSREKLRSELATLFVAGDQQGALALIEQLAAKHDEVVAKHDEVVAKHEALRVECDEAASRHDKLVGKHDDVVCRMRQLAQRVKHLLRLVYGRRSEKLTPDETAQLVLAYGGSEEDAAKAEPTVPVLTPGRRKSAQTTPDAPSLRRSWSEVSPTCPSRRASAIVCIAAGK